ncbi:hypothetical protein M1146_06930, partial [Patescibacteria group bacterium]|nr:hypothetical protein [Patescibacteria group bacterium]
MALKKRITPPEEELEQKLKRVSTAMQEGVKHSFARALSQHKGRLCCMLTSWEQANPEVSHLAPLGKGPHQHTGRHLYSGQLHLHTAIVGNMFEEIFEWMHISPDVISFSLDYGGPTLNTPLNLDIFHKGCSQYWDGTDNILFYSGKPHFLICPEMLLMMNGGGYPQHRLKYKYTPSAWREYQIKRSSAILVGNGVSQFFGLDNLPIRTTEELYRALLQKQGVNPDDISFYFGKGRHARFGWDGTDESLLLKKYEERRYEIGKINNLLVESVLKFFLF